MAMLAERKRKQKWSLNPRGNNWVQDSNKFGQKMLEKMGWQHGKGLGAKEDGITEHVKVSYKNDSNGIGYKESNDQWTEHEDNFSALLESLSGEKTVEVKLNSLEKKSQSSKARVHYHKFTRGKDLSRYSEKDLANIFGKKSLKETPKVVETERESEGLEKNENESKFLFNSGSMRDYFRKKLPNFGKSDGYSIAQNGVLKKENSDAEYEVRPSFNYKSNESDIEEISFAGFGYKNETLEDKLSDAKKTTFISYVNGNSNDEISEKNIKKKRKTDLNDLNEVLSPKKKLRKNKETKAPDLETNKGVSNPAFNPLSTPVKVQKHVLDTIEESISEDLSSGPEDGDVKYVETTVQVYESPSKKKKVSETQNFDKKSGKKPREFHNGLENSVFVETDMDNLTQNGTTENNIEICPYEVKRKESKKQKENKAKSGIPNFEEIEESSYEAKSKKSKKKKKEIQSASIDLTTEDSALSSNIEEVPAKAKKKNKEKKFALENPSFEILDDSVDLTQIEENPYEVKVQKKNKKKEAFDNPSFTESMEGNKNISQKEENPFEVQVTHKKKKKKEQTYAIENPNFNESLEESSCNSIEENPYEIKVTEKKKNKKDSYAIENPTFNASLEECSGDTIEENPYEVTVTEKKKKKKRDSYAIENPNFNVSLEESSGDTIEENPYEIKITKKKKKEKNKKEDYAIENPNFNESIEETASNDVEENPYEVKSKKKKKNKDSLAIDNPNFNSNNSLESSIDNNTFEVERKNKESSDNTSPNNSVSYVKEDISLNIEECDLMLNVVVTPIIKRTVNVENTGSITKVTSVRRRKSVRFSDVTQEIIIPNNDDLSNLDDIENRNELFEMDTQEVEKFNRNTVKNGILGLDNAGFDKHKTNMEENLDSIAKTIDNYEAEIENDINEKKLETLTMEDIMVGEVGNPHGEHERLPDGTKLKFKYASLGTKTAFYHADKTGARKSYKHLIKGDIIVGFRNTNLHEIRGYAARNKNNDV